MRVFGTQPSRTTCYDRHDLSFDGEHRDGAPGKKEEQHGSSQYGSLRRCRLVLLSRLRLRAHAERLGHAQRLPELRRQRLRARVAVQRASCASDGQADGTPRGHAVRARAAPTAPRSWRARERTLEQPGEYLCFEEGGELHTVALTREWTRIGRSLAADVRFDDPTVSRRHALIVRQPDGVRVLDDRSLNGVFVNGERIEGQPAGRRRRDHRRALSPELPRRLARQRVARRPRRRRPRSSAPRRLNAAQRPLSHVRPLWQATGGRVAATALRIRARAS